MTELEINILNCIKKKMTCNEIITLYHLTHEELWQILLSLKERGFSILRKYYYDGNIVYGFNKDLEGKNKKFSNRVIMGQKDSTFTALLVSDTHLGGENESLDKLEAVYNFCIANGINIIIHCGDFIDSFVNGKGSIPNYMYEQARQIERAIESYPYDKNILNFICLGNHDANALQKGNLNLAVALENRRHDIVPIGWNAGALEIKGDHILVGHKVNKKFPYEANSSIVLLGHKHYLEYEFDNQKMIIHVPSLDCFQKPLVKISLRLEKGLFTSGLIEQYASGGGVISYERTNEVRFNLSNTEGQITRKRVLK